jgi:GrpB-like predicted nucleotidyltransferase (UPF0157 family)
MPLHGARSTSADAFAKEVRVAVIDRVAEATCAKPSGGEQPTVASAPPLHVRFRLKGTPPHLAFRDWLRSNREAAVEYGKLKERLAELYRHDRETYTDAKTGFIEAILAKAST